MLKIRRSRDRLIFTMGIPILVRQHLYIEMAPSCLLALGAAALLCGNSWFSWVSGFMEAFVLIGLCWLLWLRHLLVQSFVVFCQIGACIIIAFTGMLTRKFNNDSPCMTISRLFSPPTQWQLSISSICIGRSSFMPPHRSRTFWNGSSSVFLPPLQISKCFSLYTPPIRV